MTAAQLARRQHLMDTVIDLVARTDPRRIQMKDVAEKAGLALATVYRYCGSKDHLLAAALAAWQNRFTRNLQIAPEPSPRTRPTVDDGAPADGAADRVAAYMHRELRAFQRHPNFAILLRIVQSSSDPFANEEIAAVGRAHGEALAGLLAGTPRELLPATVYAIGSVFNVCLMDWSAGRMPIEQAHSMLDDVVRVVVRGV